MVVNGHTSTKTELEKLEDKIGYGIIIAGTIAGAATSIYCGYKTYKDLTNPTRMFSFKTTVTLTEKITSAVLSILDGAVKGTGAAMVTVLAPSLTYLFIKHGNVPVDKETANKFNAIIQNQRIESERHMKNEHEFNSQIMAWNSRRTFAYTSGRDFYEPRPTYKFI